MLWIDMEMTGLDPETSAIIEVAVKVTDMNFNVIDTYHQVVKQPHEYLDIMDDWNKKHHRDSGLLLKISNGKEPQVVEQELIDLVKRHFPNVTKKEDKPILCGNSIHQDRLFIDRYFKKLSGLLHYRMLDVSSWKIIFREKYKVEFHKKNNHRAMDDIEESISELKSYLKYIKIP